MMAVVVDGDVGVDVDDVTEVIGEGVGGIGAG
jgi:hypothetical protein